MTQRHVNGNIKLINETIVSYLYDIERCNTMLIKYKMKPDTTRHYNHMIVKYSADLEQFVKHYTDQ